MTQCVFYSLDSLGEVVLGTKEFDSFSAARAFLREVLNNNLDVIEQANGYLAMLCNIY